MNRPLLSILGPALKTGFIAMFAGSILLLPAAVTANPAETDGYILRADVQGSQFSQRLFYRIEQSADGPISLEPAGSGPQTKPTEGYKSSCGRVDALGADSKLLRKMLPDDYLKQIAVSPDGQWALVAVADKNANNRTTSFVLVNLGQKQVVLRKSIDKHLSISDLCWHPDSHHVALIWQNSHTSKSPGHLLAAFAGHPVPYDDIHVAIFDIDSSQLQTAPEPLVRNLKYGKASLLWLPLIKH